MNKSIASVKCLYKLFFTIVAVIKRRRFFQTLKRQDFRFVKDGAFWCLKRVCVCNTCQMYFIATASPSLPFSGDQCLLSSVKETQMFSYTFNAVHLLLKNEILCSAANQGCSQTYQTDFPILWELSFINLINANEGNSQLKNFCLGLVCFIFLFLFHLLYLLVPISFTL